MPEMSDPLDALNNIIEDNDIDIVNRCRQGQTEAFSELVRRHQKKMINFAYRMIGEYDQACDVVQEAFLSAYRSLGSFRGNALFSTWLCGIVLNQARTYLKRKSIRNRREILLPEDHFQSANGGSFNTILSDEAFFVERIDRQTLQAGVQECIDKLDNKQREVLVLRDIQGHSYEEIGAILKLPSGTVRSRLFRARSDLKNHFLKMFGKTT